MLPVSQATSTEMQSTLSDADKQAGFEQGYAEGLQQASHDLAEQRAQLEGIIKTLAQPLERLNDAVEHELLELAMAVALQILRREIKLDPRHVIGLIREAIKQLPAGSRQVRVHLHPEDARVVRETLNQQGDAKRWELKDEPSLPRGGCQVHTETAFMDAGIDALIARLAVDMLGGHRTTDLNESNDEPKQPG